MKRKSTTQKKRKLMAVVCFMLLSTCLCKEMCCASVVENHIFYNNINILYGSNDDWNDDLDEEFSFRDKEDETIHQPFTAEVPEGYTPIRSIDQLQGINNNPSGKYILMNDIDMAKETSPGGSWDTGHGWTPLENFSGTFDGNGYRIIGMHIYGNASDIGYCIGLFSMLKGGSVIRNLGMVDCNIDVKVTDDSYYSVGGIAGCTDGFSSVISNCYVDGAIKADGYGNYKQVSVGGIIARGETIHDCYNMAEISVPGAGYIGGIAGSGNVKRCYNIGKINVSSKVEYGGYIAGYNDLEFASNYYLNGTFSVGDDNNEGVSSQDDKALTDAQMRHASSFTGFNFNGQLTESNWIIDELSAYPYPQLQACPQVRVNKLELVKHPDKLKYSQGDKLDLSGAVLSITYEDGVTTSTEINADMVSGIDMDKAGLQTAVVTYLHADSAFDITVEKMKASNISLSKKKCSLARNEKIQLNAEITPSNVTDKSVQWTSDNEVVATVTNKGTVRGINAGTAKITATTSNGLSASCVVTVTVPAKSITLNKTNLTLKKGKTKQLKAKLNPLETTDTIDWTSSDPRIVSVNKNGLVKAKRKGYATIMAKTSSGKRAYVKISVK